MENVDVLIGKILVEKEPSVLSAMAIQLAATRDTRTPSVLVELIKRPDLVDFRATIVNCLDGFDCASYFHLLVGLVIDGNWEVANEAFDLLNSIESISDDQVLSAFDDLERASKVEGKEEWRTSMIEDLLSMFE